MRKITITEELMWRSIAPGDILTNEHGEAVMVKKKIPIWRFCDKPFLFAIGLSSDGQFGEMHNIGRWKHAYRPRKPKKDKWPSRVDA